MVTEERKTGYKPGVRFKEALDDGWARGLGNEQRIKELFQIGFIVDDAFLNMYNENADFEMNSWFTKHQGSSSDTEVFNVNDSAV